MQAQDVMTREVETVRPDTPLQDARTTITGRAVSALPVLDAAGALVGIVSESDLLRDQVPADPRARLRRDPDPVGPAPRPRTVAEVMTSPVTTVDAHADLADVARVLVEQRRRSVPVLDGGRVVGILARRDLLRTLIRDDDAVRSDVVALLEDYTGEPGAFAVTVQDGAATVTRTRGTPDVSAAVEHRALDSLTRTVTGVLSVEVR